MLAHRYGYKPDYIVCEMPIASIFGLLKGMAENIEMEINLNPLMIVLKGLLGSE